MGRRRKNAAKQQQLEPKFDEMTVADRARSDGVTRPALVRMNGDTTLTDAYKAVVLDGLRAGMTLSAVLVHYPELPGAGVIQREKRENEEFAKAYEEARSDGQEAAIDEATDYAFATRGNAKLSASAKRYLDGVLATAGLIAPKRYGQSLKLAGADGEALKIVTVNYNATPVAIPLVAQTQEAPAKLPAPQDNTDD